MTLCRFNLIPVDTTSMTSPAYGIHWFRRDLRVAGNPGLALNWKETKGRTVGLFVFDTKFLARPDFSANRFAFFLATLTSLRNELRTLGSDLLVLDVNAVEALPALFHRFETAHVGKPTFVSWNRDYEPFARERDARVRQWLKGQGVQLLTDRDHLLIEPDELSKPTDPQATYQVFTPFSKRWYELFLTPAVQARIEQQRRGIAFLDDLSRGKGEKIFSLTWPELLPVKLPGPMLGAQQPPDDLIERYQKNNLAQVTVPIPDAGSQAALKVLRKFKDHIQHYGEARDFPAVMGTSYLSPFLKNGSITIAQAISELKLTPDSKTMKTNQGKYFTELVWREFYYHILFHHPRVEGQAFLDKFASLKWQNRADWFQAWKDGMTGFPIVDAGMRQLKTTGWMHNRVRMIVASFLTKDLLIDYRWGEQHFMSLLLDGDLAPNNGGWQWAASTGCDPQPYFRIFNPWRQSLKFDPQGDYIRKYVPELSNWETDAIHKPSPLLARNGYPLPIVEHDVQRDRALAMYKA